jgi:beta-lactamase regulating signal transducer with metallopeptidase domain
MTPLAQAIAGALFQSLWQGAVVALVLWFALALLRRSRPEARYAAACMALLLLAILPVATTWRLYSPALPAAPSGATQGRIYADVERTMVWPAAESGPQKSIYEWAFTAWLFGVTFMGLRFLWSAGQLSVLRRRGAAADDESVRFITRVAQRMNVRRFRVLFSPMTDVPSVIGWVRPVILLPAATLAGLTPAQLEAVIAHELAHIRRHDYAINILQMIVETLLFYHPAVWWMSRCIRVERELCCDDLAVRTCGDRLGYARALAAIERMRVLKPNFALGSSDGPLLFRIKRLVSPDFHQPAPSRLAGIMVLSSMAILLLGSSSHGLQLQSAQPAPAAAARINAIALPAVPAAPVAGTAPQANEAPAAAQAPARSAAPQTPATQSPGGSGAWLLRLNGRSFTNRVSPQQADALRNAYSGDFLWFTLDGVPYVTQDRNILENMASLYATPGNARSLPQNEAELAAYLNALAERRTTAEPVLRELERTQLEMLRAEELSRRGLLSESDARRLRAKHEALVDEVRAIERSLKESQERALEQSQQREQTRDIEAVGMNDAIREIAALQAQIAALRADLGQKQQEQLRLQETIRGLQAQMRELEEVRRTQADSEQAVGILREAIESGAAKPAR